MLKNEFTGMMHKIDPCDIFDIKWEHVYQEESMKR